MDVDTLLAQRLRTLRQAQGLTLAQLAERSGVSRSMISLIERQETSPTAAVLHKLARALGLSLAELFQEPAPGDDERPLSRRAAQPVWQDPASGYLRRQLSPTAVPSPVELVEVSFPAGAQVAFDAVEGLRSGQQQLWLLEGEMVLTVGERRWHLQAGDCLLMPQGPRTTFHNPTRQVARYLLVMAPQVNHSPRRP